MSNQNLAEELRKPIIRKFKKRKVSLSFKDICSADFADMQLISKFNKRFLLFLCIVDVYSKYAWVFPWLER